MNSTYLKSHKKKAAENQSGGLFYNFYSSVDEIIDKDWREVVGNNNRFLQLDYLKAMEAGAPANMKFNYVIIYKDKKPVIALYFQVVDFKPEAFNGIIQEEENDESCFIGLIKKSISNHVRKSVNKINIRLLILGNTFISGQHGIAKKEGVNDEKIHSIVAKAIDQMCESDDFDEKISAVLVKDFYSSDRNVYQNSFDKNKYHSFSVDPNMILNINPKWHTFEDYLETLSKKYRNRAKGIVKKAAAVKRKNLSADEIKKHATQIHILYMNVVQRAKFRLATLPANYFVEMKKNLQNQFQLVGYFSEDNLLGFKSYFILDNEIEAHFVGIDYFKNKELELYQNILYDYLKIAIESQKNVLNLGRTASEIKSNLGAKAHDLICFVRHRNPLSNKIIKPIFDLLKPEDWTPRNPFKED